MNEVTETNVKKSTTKSKIALGVGVAILVAVIVWLFLFASPKGVSGTKDISIEVINSDEKSVVYNLTTEAEFLRGAMDEAEGLEYSGEEGAYGLMIHTVNGELAEYDTNGAYWSFYVNGEYCNYGIDTQPINDGDEFLIAYTKAE